jgi:hypothetical protein
MVGVPSLARVTVGSPATGATAVPWARVAHLDDVGDEHDAVVRPDAGLGVSVGGPVAVGRRDRRHDALTPLGPR